MREIHVIDARAGTTAEKLRVAAYCRVSSDSDDQLNSFLAQVRHYTAYIGQNPEWELADVYADEGLTGTRMDKRDEFNRLMADCRKGQIDLILVKSTSRFARNTMEFLEALRELRQLGVTVWFENENMRTDKLPMRLCWPCPASGHSRNPSPSPRTSAGHARSGCRMEPFFQVPRHMDIE